MPWQAWLAPCAYALLLALAAWPLGLLIARALDDRTPRFLKVPLGPLEGLGYRMAGVDPSAEMGWKTYAGALLLFNAAGALVLMLLQMTQAWWPGNPDGLPNVGFWVALNTTISFITNTNWQAYSGEATMSQSTQMLGMGVQNFLSAATGLAALAAITRGFMRQGGHGLGNAWADLVRSTLYVLLPVSLVVGFVLMLQGVPQQLGSAMVVPTYEVAADGAASRSVPIGLVASQVAIKQLGTNGGGFYGVNSAHPLENPTPASDLLQGWAILVLPAACVVAFGKWVGDARQARALWLTMGLIFFAGLAICIPSEMAGSPMLAEAGANISAGPLQGGGQMEGKEARFGAATTAMWAVITTAASNGSVDGMHDSFTPLGGMVPLVMMLLGEIIFGGLGSGLYGLLAFVVLAVFLAGLMVGRSPEYLGKKLEAREVRLAALVILFPAAMVLLGTALALGTTAGLAGIFNPGIHGYSEVLYALASATNNNGSAFGGLGAGSPFYCALLGLAMLVGRYGVLLPMLAMAGGLVAKRRIPPGPGTFPTHGFIFVLLLSATIVLLGLLTYLPALALGPVVEHLHLNGGLR